MSHAAATRDEKLSSQSLRFLRDFQRPAARFRGKPFWAWNGRLEPEALRRQIRVMQQMGLGGFFMHARVGLTTPYLSGAWFDAVRACVEEAKRLGMEAWLYDEDRWPSGAAGGLVTRNSECRMRRLRVEFYRDLSAVQWGPDLVQVYAAVLEPPARARDVRALDRRRPPARLGERETLVVFRLKVDDPSPWYNGATYLDVLNPAAVRSFLRVTHEAYSRRFRSHFGRTIPGIFTDEPNFGWVLREPWDVTSPGTLHLPWTGRLPAVFRRRYGYDLRPHLLELVFDVDGTETSRARYHYLDCLTHLFVEAFAQQYGRWCERHGMLFTGHVLHEETLAAQAGVVGSCMRFYEHMQAPGMDLLTERSREFLTAKQVSSVARQFGRRWRLTETYGCTGWDFSFAGHKALGDWQVALGINLRCHHLFWYTMLGEAKRDYPASIGHQSPWWDLYRHVEDYFARIHAVMTRGTEVRDVLVIHPVESVWLRIRAGWRSDECVEQLDRDLRCVIDCLLEAHLDFDFGDEELLARHGRVSVRKGQPVLLVGRAEYRAVVIPPQLTMRRTTLDLLRRFHDRGGRVVFAGRVASCLDAMPSDEVERWSSEAVRVPIEGDALARAVEGVARRVSIATTDTREIPGVLYLLREDREAHYLFLCNTSHPFDREMLHPRVCERKLEWPEVVVRAFAGCQGEPLELDPETGAVYTAEAERDGDGWKIRTRLPALGSRLFVAPRRPVSAPRANPRPRLVETRRTPLEDGPWAIQRSEPNVLVLDRCRWRIGRDVEQPPADILHIDGFVRDRLGIPRRDGAMVQPWARPPVQRPRSVAVELCFEFEAEALPEGPLWLALERPDVCTLEFNGYAVPALPDGWWVDESLQRIPLPPGILRLGINVIRLRLSYEETFSGLEPLYLLGEFGVRVDGNRIRLIDRSRELRPGDWGDQGLPFYAGHVVYRRRVRIDREPDERVSLRLPEIAGVGARIWVDGTCAGQALWPPYEVDLTDFAKPGGHEVELGIEVLGHRRNSHGPLHYKEKWPSWTGPWQLNPSGGDHIPSYQRVPCGLMRTPEWVFRRPTV